MEDFGYLKYEEQGKASTIIKKGLLIGAVLLSIFCFGYITISAYYFVYHEEDSDIRIIKAAKEVIKTKPANSGSDMVIKDMDKVVYENIAGSKKESLQTEDIKIVETPQNTIKPKPETTRSGTIQHSRIIQSDNKEEEIDLGKEAASDPTPQKLVRPNAQTNITKNEEVKKKPSAPVNRVQIAALSSNKAANEYWSNLKKEYPKLFSSDLQPFVQKIDLGKKGIFYRLQIGDFDSQVAAEDFCIEFINKAQKNKVDCIIVE
ncbi:MAG: SPOR domain-containing protein [Proteobacteria bacterium]|nr:SPOR domain-containing protein [Pseudomonadota bacterium]